MAQEGERTSREREIVVIWISLWFSNDEELHLYWPSFETHLKLCTGTKAKLRTSRKKLRTRNTWGQTDVPIQSKSQTKQTKARIWVRAKNSNQALSQTKTPRPCARPKVSKDRPRTRSNRRWSPWVSRMRRTNETIAQTQHIEEPTQISTLSLCILVV